MSTSKNLEELTSQQNSMETTMQKQASLADMWQSIWTVDNQAVAAPAADLEKMAAADANLLLDEMCKEAAVQYINENDEQKQAADYYGRLYANMLWQGFTKAAELNGVFVKNDDTVDSQQIPTNPQNTMGVENAGAGADGYAYLMKTQGKKPVGGVFNPANATVAGAQYSVPAATK